MIVIHCVTATILPVAAKGWVVRSPRMHLYTFASLLGEGFRGALREGVPWRGVGGEGGGPGGGWPWQGKGKRLIMFLFIKGWGGEGTKPT